MVQQLGLVTPGDIPVASSDLQPDQTPTQQLRLPAPGLVAGAGSSGSGSAPEVDAERLSALTARLMVSMLLTCTVPGMQHKTRQAHLLQAFISCKDSQHSALSPSLLPAFLNKQANVCVLHGGGKPGHALCHVLLSGPVTPAVLQPWHHGMMLAGDEVLQHVGCCGATRCCWWVHACMPSCVYALHMAPAEHLPAPSHLQSYASNFKAKLDSWSSPKSRPSAESQYSNISRFAAGTAAEDAAVKQRATAVGNAIALWAEADAGISPLALVQEAAASQAASETASETSSPSGRQAGSQAGRQPVSRAGSRASSQAASQAASEAGSARSR
jgi:hypothetical protein